DANGCPPPTLLREQGRVGASVTSPHVKARRRAMSEHLPVDGSRVSGPVRGRNAGEPGLRLRGRVAEDSYGSTKGHSARLNHRQQIGMAQRGRAAAAGSET